MTRALERNSKIERPAGELECIARPPSLLEQRADIVFRGCCYVIAWLVIALVIFIVAKIAWSSIPAISAYGFPFLTGQQWDPNAGTYGILPEIFGTLVSSTVAILLSSFMGIAIAIFLSEGLLSSVLRLALRQLGIANRSKWSRLPEKLERGLLNVIELLAAIPSVVYGLWGIYVVIPTIRPYCNFLNANFEWFPLFGTPLSGPGLFPAAMVLSIMILPTIASLSRDAVNSVPIKLREAAYALGSTRWEAIFMVILPAARNGIIGAILLGFGRALGETMALAMLTGNSNRISWSLFSPGNTLAALLANNFPEASKNQVPTLMYAALVLLAITLGVNLLGAIVQQSATRKGNLWTRI